MAASYEARARGVRSATGARQALRQCPDLIIVPPRISAYTEASRQVFEIFEQTTPWVEALSIDEAFLDVGGLRGVAGQPASIAMRLRREVAERVGLPITVGVARSKFLAKVASQMAKPDGMLMVPPGGELRFLHPLPVERLWGVGEVTSRKLRDSGLRTVGDIAALNEPTLISMLGQAAGRHLHALAHARDPRRVDTRRRRRSIGSQRALGRRERSDAELDAVLVAIVDRLSRRLRAGHRLCRTVVLRLRFADFSRATRSHTIAQPTERTADVLVVARTLLSAVTPMIRERGLTLLGLSLTNLVRADAVQLPLPFERRPTANLDAALDTVHDRFGSGAITRAVLLGRDTGQPVPLLPD